MSSSYTSADVQVGKCIAMVGIEVDLATTHVRIAVVLTADEPSATTHIRLAVARGQEVRQVHGQDGCIEVDKFLIPCYCW